MSHSGTPPEVIRNRIYVGQLSETTRELDLRRFLRGFGDIKQIMLMRGFAFVEFEEESDAEDAIHDLDGESLNGEIVSVRYAIVPRDRATGANYATASRQGGDGGTEERRPDRNWRQDGDDDEENDDRPRRNDGDRTRVNPRSFRQPDAKVGENTFYGPLVESPWRVVVKNLSTKVSWQDLKDFMRTAGDVTFTSAHHPIRNEGVAEYGNPDAMQRALDELDGAELEGLKVEIVRPEGNGGGRRGGEWRRGERGGERGGERRNRGGARGRDRRKGKDDWRKGEKVDDWRRGGRGGRGSERDWGIRDETRMRSGRIEPLMGTERNEREEMMGYSDVEDGEEDHSGSEGPGEGCYSVCLSKEIKKLHEEINAIGNHESGGGQVEIPGLKKVEKTTEDNSAKLDELLKVVQNITADDGSSQEIDELRRQLSSAESTIKDLKAQNELLAGDNGKASAKIKELESRVKSLQKSLVSSEKHCQESRARLNQTINALEGELEDRLTKIEQLEEENKVLKEKLEQSKGMVDKLKGEVEAEKKVVEESKNKVDQLTNSLAEEKKKLQESSDLNKDLRNKLDAEEKKADANEKVIADLNARIKEEFEKITASEATIKNLTKELEEEKKKLEEAEERLKEAERKLQEAIDNAAKCEEAVKKLTSSLEAEKKKAAKCGSDLVDVNGKLAKKEAEAKGLGDQLGECEKKSEQNQKEAQEKFENMKKDLDQLLREKATLTKEVGECRQKQKEMKEKVGDLEKTVEDQKAEIIDLTKKNKDLKEENRKKTVENAKLKSDLEEALKNAGSGEETTKLKEENEKLKKENESAKKQIEDLNKEIDIISKGQKSAAVDYAGAVFGATSESLFSEAEKAFTDDHYSSWTSQEEAPQTIWIQMKKALRLTRFSFKCSIAPENGASKFEIVATNDASCNAHSAWDVIYQDLSGKGFATDEDTMVAEVDSCKLYNCYGIRVLDVNNIQGQKWVIMSEVKLWARA